MQIDYVFIWTSCFLIQRQRCLLSCCLASDISVLDRSRRRHRNGLSMYLSWMIRVWTGWWISGWRLVVASRRWILHNSLLRRASGRHELLIRRLACHNHSTGRMIAVIRTTGTATAGYDGNDDSKEDYCTNYSACNASCRPNTWIKTFATAANLQTRTFVIARAGKITIIPANAIRTTVFSYPTVAIEIAGHSTLQSKERDQKNDKKSLRRHCYKAKDDVLEQTWNERECGCGWLASKVYLRLLPFCHSDVTYKQ